MIISRTSPSGIFFGRILFGAALIHGMLFGLFAFSFHSHTSLKPPLTFLGSIVGKFEFAKIGASKSSATTPKIPPTTGTIGIPRIPAARESGAAIQKPASHIKDAKQTLKVPVWNFEPCPAEKQKEKSPENEPAFRSLEPLKIN